MDSLTTRIDAYFRAIALSDSLDAAIKSTSLFLNRPVAIIDTAMNHLGHYPDTLLGDGDWDTLLTDGHVHASYTPVTRHNNAIAIPPDMLHRCIHSPPNDTEMEKYRCRLSSGMIHLGGMMVLGNGRPFTEEDMTALQLACQTLSRSLHDFHEPMFSAQRARQSILCDLLTRDPHDVLDEIEAKHPDLYALEGHPMAIGYADPHPGDYDLAAHWQKTLSSYIAESQVIQHQGSLLFFFPLGDIPFQSFVAGLENHLSQIHMQVGLSDPFVSFLQFKAQYDNARQALHAGTLNTPGRPLCTVAENRLAILTGYIAQSESACSCCHPAIHAMLVYDQQNSAHTCRILRTYLTQFHNYSLAAQALFMHRNTLTYHLDRIARTFDVDLNDPTTCSELLLSLQLLGAGL